MSNLRKEIISVIEQAIDVPLMDVYNISGMILDYYKEPALTYWSEGKFTAITTRSKLIGYIPKADPELLNRVKELISLGWDNSDRRIPLDRTSWNMKKEHLRNMIMDL
jgi:hypothetical protein